jgi:hypothetical protein
VYGNLKPTQGLTEPTGSTSTSLTTPARPRLEKIRQWSNDWTTNNFSVTAGAGNDSLVDTPTPYGTDTGVGGEVRGNYAQLRSTPIRLHRTLWLQSTMHTEST